MVWTKIEYKLPKFEEDVIVFGIGYEKPCIGQLQKVDINGPHFYLADSGLDVRDVTHWMPMIELPI